MKHGCLLMYYLMKELPQEINDKRNIIAPFGPICIDGMSPAGAQCHSDREYLCFDNVIPAFEFSNLMIRDLAEKKGR